ncbi:MULTISPECIES: PAS domain-containing sensor histidine kinase [unclassified Nocardioides]|uniref:PAS domain-containing sensor histidine kinase n=1 Tax=unclassified Nocardioides TaxID=2615069 RepID=UPI003615BD49
MTISELEQLTSSTLLAQTGLLVAASDSAGQIALLSPGMQELFELPFEPVPEDEISDRFRLFTHDGSTALPTEDVPLVRARRGEVVRDALIVSRTPAGRLLYLRCNASPLIGPDGSLNGAIVLVQDVTDERAAHERQSELRERLLETVNHHLRTPVTSLLGYAELLDDQRAGITPEAQRAVDAVLRAAGALGSLLETVSALLDLDRHTQLTKTYGDLTDVVQHVAHAFMPLLDENRVELHVDQPSTLPAVMDFAEVRRAVSELLKNAACYAPAGSVVWLHTRLGDDATVDLTVSDNGPGIDDDERHRLVEPFERGNHPRQDVTGRGLGLAIAHTIALAHGGALELSANRPQGLCASLRLPIR